MKKINIGASDLQVGPLNLGGNVFGWTLDETQSFDILNAFTAEGYNFIDTADTYSVWKPGNIGGESETIIGNWMKAKGNRSDIILATKVGWDFGDGKRKGLSTKYIAQAAEESLKRLQTDYIDLYYTHIDDETVPVEETLTAYDKLIKEGKVRYIAASNLSPARLTESLSLSEKMSLPKYQALQPHYNLLERELFETEYAPIASEHHLTVFPYWSLAAGFLTGKYRSEEDLSKSTRGQGATKYLNEKGLNVLKALDIVAHKHNSVPATVALAWLLAQPLIGAPIVSATSRAQLATLFDAPKLKLDHEDLAILDASSK
jgi:aryl-alcohol dehydrogenase-like predicted oxidoreductase